MIETFITQLLTLGITQLLTLGITQLLTLGVTRLLTLGITQLLTLGITQLLTLRITRLLTLNPTAATLNPNPLASHTQMTSAMIRAKITLPPCLQVQQKSPVRSKRALQKPKKSRAKPCSRQKLKAKDPHHRALISEKESD